MTDYTKHCWSCGKGPLEAEGSYYQCPDCGATYNELPEPRTFIDVERHYDGAEGTPAYRPVKRRGKTLLKGKK